MATTLALLPDFLLILLGHALRRWLHLGDHFWGGLEKLVYFIFFPALLFNALARANLDWATAAPLLSTGLLIMLTGMVLGGLARWLFAMSPVSFASQFQCAFRFNTYIGLAVAAKLHGAPGLAAMGLLTGAMVPPANIAAVGMLARHGGTSLLSELARNPLVIGTLAGLLWNVSGLVLPVPAAQFLGRLADAAITLGLLAVGAALKLDHLPGGGYGSATWFLSVKLLILPLAALGLGRWFDLDAMYRDIALIFAALPTSSSAFILARRMGGDGRSVAWLISASTLAAMVTLPLWLAFGR
ncbi:MAG: AEC family transporter [Rhodocyclaceae bacterium]|nr:AEC family transporter [Rhodocyclaceae bacterium]MBK6555150.1 AEC family transporter [Rhodocyclaceae bacterium]MBK6676899.1 AEC family transporter [Rhodocyclaceae bacterium]MBK9309568.1 AEC family transporter [Rhodocyclaceae bacterium]MBK9955342.1 AEC family transporter [Rhodocyclaceae bacterium]